MNTQNTGARANKLDAASKRGWRRKCQWLAPLAAIVLTLGTGFGQAHAADGDLDTTFGGTGKVATGFTWLASGQGVAVQSDGKIVVAGYQMGFETHFALARYNTNGTLDATFDGDGKVTTEFNSGIARASAVTIQPDGKIVVVGTYTDNYIPSSDFAIARYNINGTLDASFDGDGKLLVGFVASTSDDGARAVAIYPNGKIMVGGYSRFLSQDFALIRLTTTGALDATFDGDGAQTTDFGGDEAISSIAIQPDAKVVVGGSALIAGGQDFALARYSTNGTLDYAFDTDGKVTTDISVGGVDRISGLALSPDGRIVAAGSISFGSSGAFAVARYSTTGNLDTTFDGDGRTTTSFGGPAFGQAVVIQPDSKIAVAGYVDTGATSNDFALARYTSTGTLDTSFGGDGKVITDFSNSDDKGAGLALQVDGKLIAVGGSDVSFALARYKYTAPSPTPTPSSTSVPPTITTVPTSTPAGTSVPTPCPIQFSDVAEGSTFYPYVRCLACRNILSGYADGTFKPGNNITRGQLSKIVSNAAGFAEEHNAQSFEDVLVASTFYQFVERMHSRGIIGGYSCGGAGEPCNSPTNRPYFRSGANATRGQIAKVVSNAAGYSDNPVGQQFEDVSINHPFYLWIARISSRGIISGYACGGAGEQCVAPSNRPYFRSQNDATRGQVSKIIANTFYPNCNTP